MKKEKDQIDENFRWKVVGQEEVSEATKEKNAKKEKSDAAMKALSNLKLGEAIRVALPKGCRATGRLRYRASCDSASLRGWWGTKMRSVSKKEGIARAFLTITSSDGKFLFIQRMAINNS